MFTSGVYAWTIESKQKGYLCQKQSQPAVNIQAEKLELIEKIIQIEDENTLEQIRAVLEAFPIPKGHRLLLDERLAEHRANSEAGERWEIVKARIASKLWK